MKEAVVRWRDKALKMLSWLPPHPCPIKGCTYKWRLKDTLGLHLYQRHRKGELVTHVLDEMIK